MLRRRLSKEELFQKVDTQSIFNHYFGPFVCYRKSYPSIFRKDSNPSTGFFLNEDGEVVYSDLGTGEKWGAISFVMKLYDLNYQDAINKIAQDFGVLKGSNTSEPVAKIVRQKIAPKEDKIIEITTSGWNKANLQFWKDFHITQEELEKHKVFPVNKLFINGFMIKSDNNYSRFAFLFDTPQKEYLKIYSPYEKEFKWITNCPLKIPFGYNDLEYKSDTLLITKSLKDMIVCRKFFPDVMALQNESIAAFDDELLNPILSKYKKVIIWFDCDKAGIKALEPYKEKGFITYTLEKKFLGFDVKDPADFVKKWGLSYFKIYLKQNELLKSAMLDV